MSASAGHGGSEDTEILEINDYSQATAYERCVGAFERQLREWERQGACDVPGVPPAVIDYNGVQVKLTFYAADARAAPGAAGPSDAAGALPPSPKGIGHDLLDAASDFTTCAACELQPLFGTSRYAVAAPVDYDDAAHSHPDLAEALLSMMCTAAGNARVTYPCFVEDFATTAANMVPVMLYVGRGAAGGVVTTYTSEHAPTTPDHCNTLDGLLDLFYRNLKLRESGTEVAARFSYERRQYNQREWRHLMDVENKGAWGTAADPVVLLRGRLTWPKTRDSLVDNSVWSTFDPTSPPVVDIELSVADITAELFSATPVPPCDGRLGARAARTAAAGASQHHDPTPTAADSAPPSPSSAVDAVEADSAAVAALGTCTLSETVKRTIDMYLDAQYGHAREDREYTPIPYLSRARRGGGGWRAQAASMISNGVRSLSGAAPTAPQAPSKQEVERMRVLAHDLLYGPQGVTVAAATDAGDAAAGPPLTSFMYHLAAAAQAKGVFTTAELAVVYEVAVDYLTRCWDTLTPIPHTGVGGLSEHAVSGVDQVVHQLNCCIDGARRAAGGRGEAGGGANRSLNGWDSADDRSFGTVESSGESGGRDDADGWGSDGSLEDPDIAAGRRGHKTPLPGARCRGGHAIYIPHTQVAIPTTDADVAQREDFLTSLGTGAAGAALRLRVQADTLLSDMRAFKAANPQDTLDFADFLAWYSPGDVVDAAAKTVSARMAPPDTLWRQLWDEAAAQPAAAQVPLVNFASQAALALKTLRAMPLAKVAQSVANHSLAHAFARLRGTSKAGKVPVVRERFNAAAVRFYAAAARLSAPAKLEGYQRAVGELEQLEVLLSLASSMWDRFMSPITEFAAAADAISVVDALLSSFVAAPRTTASARLSPAQWRALALSFLPDGTYDGSLDNIRPPDTREFIVRCVADRPARVGLGSGAAPEGEADEDCLDGSPAALPCAHRMYASAGATRGFLVCLSMSERVLG